MERCLGTTPWESSDLEVPDRSAKVRIAITSSIVARMGQVRSPSALRQRVDVDGVVVVKK